MNISIPEEYLNYVTNDGLMESLTDGEPGYFILWPVSEIEKLNAQYQVEKYMAGFLGFGSDGGGEMLAFDANGAIYKLPFVGYSSKKDAIKVAACWSEIADRVSNE